MKSRPESPKEFLGLICWPLEILLKGTTTLWCTDLKTFSLTQSISPFRRINEALRVLSMGADERSRLEIEVLASENPVRTLEQFSIYRLTPAEAVKLSHQRL
jgi:hypothetical protein